MMQATRFTYSGGPLDHWFRSFDIARARLHIAVQREAACALSREVAPGAARPFRAPHDAGGVPRRPVAAFTLVELLAVMTVIGLILALATPVFNVLRGSNDFGVAVGNLTGMFEQARAYAVANNTYVYVGIAEFDAVQSRGANPQAPGTGRVVTCAVASRDGTRGYNLYAPDWVGNYPAVAANLVPIDKLKTYENLHLADFSAQTPPASGSKMSRPSVPRPYSLGYTDASNPVQTPIAWPLGKSQNGGQYQFNKVIQFDPQGVARLQFATNSDYIVPTMEMALQPTHGNVALAPPANQNVGNQAVIQIDCMTSAVRFYRP